MGSVAFLGRIWIDLPKFVEWLAAVAVAIISVLVMNLEAVVSPDGGVALRAW